jgi:hypothetical protein
MDSEFIYHYTRFSTAVEKIIPKRRLLLSNLANSNDPREYKKFIFAASYWPTDTVYDPKNQDDINTKILIDDCKFISFSAFYNDYLGFEYSNMWAHYGEKHKGICLRINKEKFAAENELTIKKGSFKSVSYFKLDISKGFPHHEVQYPQSQSQEVFKKYLRNEFRNEYMDFLYFMKREEWFSEHEIRLVIFSEDPTKEYCSIEDSLSGIILGLEYDSKNDPFIYDIAQQIPISMIEYNGDRIIEKEYKPSPKKRCFKFFR